MVPFYGERAIYEEPSEGYDDIMAFIETVSNAPLQARLEGAIRGQGAFRRFKGVLLDHPKERERPFAFSQERLHMRIRDWLQSEGIEIIDW